MATHCSDCGVTLESADVMYSSTGEPICQRCRDRHEVAQALDEPHHGFAGPGEYEFSPNENAVIHSLAGPVRFVGIMWIIFGVLSVVLAFRVFAAGLGGRGLLALLQAAVPLAIGAWLVSGATALTNVVRTHGADMTHLMKALTKLRNVFLLQAILIGLSIVLVLFSGLAGIGR